MFALLRRCWNAMVKPEPVDALEPVRPMVTPDPRDAAALERRREELSYQPETPFHSSMFMRKAK